MIINMFFWGGFPMTFGDQTHILFFNIVQQSLFSSGFVYPFQILWRNPQIDVGMTRGPIFTITWSMSIFSHIHIINSQELTQVGLENVSLRRRAVMIFCFLCPMASFDAWAEAAEGRRRKQGDCDGDDIFHTDETFPDKQHKWLLLVFYRFYWSLNLIISVDTS